MDEAAKELKSRLDRVEEKVNKLSNVAWVLGALAVVFGLTGASIWTKLSEAQKKVDDLKTSLTDQEKKLETVRASVSDSQAKIATEVATGQKALQLAADGQIQRIRALAGVPTGSVLPFRATGCPQGWSEFTRGVGRVIIGAGDTIALNTVGGRREVSLTVPNLPPHKHDTLVGAQASYAVWGRGAKKEAVLGRASEQFETGMTSEVGSGTAIDVMPPFVALRFCEKQ